MDKIAQKFDKSYSSFISPESTDNFDFISPDKRTGLEITLIITENEKCAHEYYVNYNKGKRNLRTNNIRECRLDNSGRIHCYYGGSIKELKRLVFEAIKEKNKKAKKRLINNNQIVNAELCLTIVDGGMIDNFFVQDFNSLVFDTVFEKVFFVTSNDIFVISK